MMEIGVSTSVEAEETVMDTTNSSHSDGVLEAKHKVFLSHSGMQKDFVEQLCIDLEASDRYPFFDKRRSSLPIGVKFPALIFDAIQQCDVGVLILSKEFFTRTKWPMLELVAMVKEVGRAKLNSSRNIIPVFYNLSREEWLDEGNRSKWISQWEEWASEDSRISIEEWKMALDALKSINSLMVKDGEVSLRREIVGAVCNLVLPETRWDDFHVQGRSRLCAILTKKIREGNQRSGIQVTGIHGIGGIGKTTICKVMCNELFQEFQGKVCHVELNGASEVELLHEVLKSFTNIEHELLVGLNMDKCRDKLKRCIVKDPIFLAIDNLSDNQEARKQAKTLLGTKWGAGSVVMVTARSLGGLASLNQYIYDGDCIEMPELERDEATCLFWNHVTSGQDPTFGIDEGLVGRCVERCHFSKGEGKGRHYIPLALEVLGEQLGCLGDNPELWEEQLTNIDSFGQKLSSDKHPIFSILRTSYDSLSDDAKMSFMDAALFLPSHDFHEGNEYKWNLYNWLSMVHGSGVSVMMRQLEGLKRRALLGNLGDGRMKMGMHDLWREFCVAEATVGKFEGGRCLFLEEESSKLAESSPGPESCWRNMKRMCFLNEGWRGLKGVQLDHFVNLTVLKVETGSFIVPGSSLELDLKGLKHLKSLELKMSTRFNSQCTGLGSLANLAYLRWINYSTPSPNMEEIGRLTKLEVLHLHGFDGDKLPDLSMLTSLRLVVFLNCFKVMIVTGLSSKLSNIQYLNLAGCRKLQECPGLGAVSSLEELIFQSCHELKEVPCLRLLTRLRILCVIDCWLLRAVPGLSDLVALEELWANGCERLEVLPDLRELSKLRFLVCRSCRALKSLTCTRPLPALEKINLSLCSSLEELPDMSNFPQLKWLILCGCTSLMRLTNSAPLRALLRLDLEGCSKLSALPDHLSSSADLRELRLQKSGIVLHEDDMRELQASCRRLVVFPSSAWSKYGIELPGISTVRGSDERKTEVDDMEVNVQNQCRSRRLPDSLPRDKVTKLTYTNAGGSLLALTSTGMHKLWNWGCELNDPRYQATISFAPQLWQPASGMLMINDIDEESVDEVVSSLALAQNDSYVISASGGRVDEFEIRSFQRVCTIMRPPPAATSLAYYPDDCSIKAIGMEDSTIQILDSYEKVVVCTLAGHQKRIINLAFSKSSTNCRSVLVSLGADAQLCLWKTEEWSKRQSKYGPLQPDRRIPCVGDIGVQFRNDQRHILVVGKSQLAVYDATNLDCPFLRWVPESPFTAPITDATFSCDGHIVYATFADGSICDLRAYDLQPGRRLAPPIHTSQGGSGSTAYPLAIAAHPKQPGQFALGMSDGSVIVVEPSRVLADNASNRGEANGSAAVRHDPRDDESDK